MEKFKGEMDVIATKVNIEFDNLGLVLKGGKKVLSGVTGTIRSGRVTGTLSLLSNVFPTIDMAIYINVFLIVNLILKVRK